MLALTLLIGLAGAQDVPADASSSADPPPAEDTLVWSSDPLGQGDDRTARRVESMLGEQRAALLACRDGRPDSGRILSTQVKFQIDGTVKWARAKLSTGDDVVDGCVLEILQALVLDPAPQFADKLRVNLRWKPPETGEP